MFRILNGFWDLLELVRFFFSSSIFYYSSSILIYSRYFYLFVRVSDYFLIFVVSLFITFLPVLVK